MVQCLEHFHTSRCDMAQSTVQIVVGLNAKLSIPCFNTRCKFVRLTVKTFLLLFNTMAFLLLATTTFGLLNSAPILARFNMV